MVGLAFMNGLAEPVNRPQISGLDVWRTHRDRGVLLGVFILMAILEIGLTFRQCLWADEVFSLAVATGHSLEHPAAAAHSELGDFVEGAQPVEAKELWCYLQHDNPPASPARVVRAVLLSDTSPPLYYLLLYSWTLICGTRDVALRLFSTLWSLACFPLLAIVARRTMGKRGVIPTCVLFAFSPLGLYFSGEVRMYSLLLFCVLATVSISLILQQQKGGVVLYILWIAASAAGFLTHYFFVFPWLAVVLFLMLEPGNFGRQRLVGCILVLGLAILPWYLNVPGSSNRWRVTQDWLKLRPKDFHRFKATRNHVLQFFSSNGSGLWEPNRLFAATSSALFGAVAIIMAWRLRWRMFFGPRLLIWLWFVAAAAAPTLIDVLRSTYVANQPRYALAALPAAYLLSAMGLICLNRRWRAIVLLLIVLGWLPFLFNIYWDDSRSNEPFRRIADTLSQDGSASDVILVDSAPSAILGIARYMKGTCPVTPWVQQLGTRHVPESITMLAAGYSRVLFVKTHPSTGTNPEEDWLRRNAVVLRQQRIGAPGVGGARIVVFANKNAATF